MQLPRRPGHGTGFDKCSAGLANHEGYLRFRSGDAAVLIGGAGPGLVNRKVKEKPQLQGFLASEMCRR
jgi:hypothetical protein